MPSEAWTWTRAGVGRVIVCEQHHVGAGATGKSGALVRTHYTNEPAFVAHTRPEIVAPLRAVNSTGCTMP